jgi:hypothetical protein
VLDELPLISIDVLGLLKGHFLGVLSKRNFFRLLFHLSFVILLGIGSSAHLADLAKNFLKHLVKKPLIEIVENAIVGFFDIVLDLE